MPLCALPYVSSNICSHSPARTKMGRNWRPPTHQPRLCHEKTKEIRIQMESPFALCWAVGEHGKADLPRRFLSSNPGERMTRTGIPTRAGNVCVCKPFMLLGRQRIKKFSYRTLVFMKGWIRASLLVNKTIKRCTNFSTLGPNISLIFISYWGGCMP